MKIEVLYPELCNVFADVWNVKYLGMCCSKIEIHYTKINEEPLFVKKDVDMIYVPSMPYVHQEIIVNKLSKYKKRLKELIEKEKIVLFTGDATEIIGNYIYDVSTDKKTNGIGLFDVYFERNFNKRINYFFLGNYDNMKIVGSASTFSMMYGDNTNKFIEVVKGLGMGNDNTNEGICYKNFYATKLIGPFLLLNPDFTKMILHKLGYDGNLCFEKDIYDAYEKRLLELEGDVKIFPDDHG